MIAILCTLLSAAGFYCSLGLGSQWWLAWIAPVPVLWYAFGPAKPFAAFLAAWLAFALGATSYLKAYAGVLPVPVLAIGIAGPAVLFALAALGARRVLRSRGPIAATLAFAALWTAFDMLTAFGSIGSAGSPADAEAGAPALIQGASLVGFLGITFLLGAVGAGLALGVRTRKAGPAGLALGLFAVNALYGCVRISAPAAGTVRVALIDSDSAVGNIGSSDRTATLAAVDAYATQIERLRGRRVQLIVLPENIARLDSAWRAEAEAKLAEAADAVGAELVAGFNAEAGGAHCNVALAFAPGSEQPVTYAKRGLIPVLESSIYARGSGPQVLPDGTGLEICKDMDFQDMIRRDERATRPRLLAVPAWDFYADAWAHGRVAVLRSVENGVPMARNARRGLLTLNDRFGRVVATATAVKGFTVLIGDLPVDGRGGETLYDRIGDGFGWLCLLFGAGMVALSWLPGAKR